MPQQVAKRWTIAAFGHSFTVTVGITARSKFGTVGVGRAAFLLRSEVGPVQHTGDLQHVSFCNLLEGFSQVQRPLLTCNQDLDSRLAPESQAGGGRHIRAGTRTECPSDAVHGGTQTCQGPHRGTVGQTEVPSPSEGREHDAVQQTPTWQPCFVTVH